MLTLHPYDRVWVGPSWASATSARAAATAGGRAPVLTVLSGRESTVRRLDLLRDAVGDDPAQWFPALTGRRWPGAAGSDGADVALLHDQRLVAHQSEGRSVGIRQIRVRRKVLSGIRL